MGGRSKAGLVRPAPGFNVLAAIQYTGGDRCFVMLVCIFRRSISVKNVYIVTFFVKFAGALSILI